MTDKENRFVKDINVSSKEQEYKELKSNYEHLQDLYNQALKDLDKLQNYINEKEIWGDQCEFCKHNDKENCHQNIILDNLKTINSYRKTLGEIEEMCINDVYKFADGTELRYDTLDDILDIINKTKGEL